MTKYDIIIGGMTCTSCEVLLERKFKKISGVKSAQLDHKKGVAVIEMNSPLSKEQLQDALKDTHYVVKAVEEHGKSVHDVHQKNTSKDYLQIAGIFVVILGGYLLLRNSGLWPEGLQVSEGMSYGFIFVMGLIAAMSTCLAVTGGLILVLAEKFHQRNPTLDGVRKFEPHIYFNAGRVISYTILGGLVGALGSVLSLSSKVSGIVTIIASVVMIVLGLRLLNVLPSLQRFIPTMPKFIAHRILDNGEKEHRAGPFVLGAATFFLPCGFTQALQLYVLSTGDFATGAFTMLAFSLGTLPGLMSIGLFSSFTKGNVHKQFVRIAAVLVIILGVLSIKGGIVLSGAVLPVDDGIGVVDMQDNLQVITMNVDGFDYSPAQFTLKKGVPVEWRIDGTKAQGCAQIISVPKLGITKQMSTNEVTVITFTPTFVGKIPFSCGMGMAGPGLFTVVE